MSPTTAQRDWRVNSMSRLTLWPPKGPPCFLSPRAGWPPTFFASKASASLGQVRCSSRAGGLLKYVARLPIVLTFRAFGALDRAHPGTMNPG